MRIVERLLFLLNISINQLQQTLPSQHGETVYECVASGLSGVKRLVDEYHHRSHQAIDKGGLKELEELYNRIDVHGGWELDIQVEKILTELDLPVERKLGKLSGEDSVV